MSRGAFYGDAFPSWSPFYTAGAGGRWYGRSTGQPGRLSVFPSGLSSERGGPKVSWRRWCGREGWRLSDV